MDEPLFPDKKLFKRANNAILNKPNYHSVAAVSWYILVTQDTQWVDGSVSISDCSRAITLDLCYGEEQEDYENSLHKVDVLIDKLEELKQALIESRPIQVKDIERRKQEKERKKEDVKD